MIDVIEGATMNLRTAYLTDLAIQSMNKLMKSADPYYLDAAMDFTSLAFADIEGDNDSCSGCGAKGTFGKLSLCNDCWPKWEQAWVDSLLVDVALASAVRSK
jgi:hypothetical protein